MQEGASKIVDRLVSLVPSWNFQLDYADQTRENRASSPGENVVVVE